MATDRPSLAWLRASPSVADLRLLGEALAAIVATWLLLGWRFDHAITQADGTVQWVPYFRSALAGGVDWTSHLYRFGVLGGSQMHDSGGTLPLVQVAAALGLGATTTANLVTIVLQLAFAFFGLKITAALVGAWSGTPTRLAAPARLTTIWACAFAPLLGWRLAMGHENLVLGLLPLQATIGTLLAARDRTLSATTLGFATLIVFTGLSGLGPQTVVYGAVFGAPLLAIVVLDAPRGARWGRPQWAVAAALAAGVLLTLPRLVGMILHAVGDDFGRGGAGALTYSYGTTGWSDWVTSIPWTAAFADGLPRHEHNLPIGPLACLLALTWRHRPARRLAACLVGGAVVAVLFADDVAPISTGLLKLVPPLASFRVPARAILPPLMFLPPVALAALWSAPADGPPPPPRLAWGYLAASAGLIVVGGSLPPVAREVAAWLGALALVLTARWAPARFGRHALAAALALVVALGVGAFAERFPRGGIVDPIEAGPRRLHDAVLAQAPEVAMALNRIQVVDAPLPYEMSTAFAAGLPSLDGAWYPTHRFLELLAALLGKPVDPTTGVFRLTRTPAFPALQQLYNVRYVVTLGREAAIEELPPTAGPVWFPRHVVEIDAPAELAAALAARRDDLRAAITDTAWIRRGDAVPPRAATCVGAAVRSVTTDDLGQQATITVDAPAACVLVVATNYVTTLRAIALGGERSSLLAVFPIDVALTGVAVPAGTTRIVLAPVPRIPWWARAASGLGLALLVGAVALGRGRRRA